MTKNHNGRAHIDSSRISAEPFLPQIAVIMVPSKAIVADLMASATQQWLDGANSIKVPGGSLSLPLWTLQVWVELHLIVVPARISWQKSINWLQREDLGLFQEKVHSVYHSLSTLSWSSARGPGGLLSALPGKTTFPKSTLAKYLSRDWLTDEHVDQMIYLVEKEVKEILPHRKIQFLDTVLIRKLQQAYQLEIDGEENYNPFDTTFLHRFGKSLSSDSQLAGIFHINGNHWISDVPARARPGYPGLGSAFNGLGFRNLKPKPWAEMDGGLGPAWARPGPGPRLFTENFQNTTY